jgi:hypothetical protein
LTLVDDMLNDRLTVGSACPGEAMFLIRHMGHVRKGRLLSYYHRWTISKARRRVVCIRTETHLLRRPRFRSSPTCTMSIIWLHDCLRHLRSDGTLGTLNFARSDLHRIHLPSFAIEASNNNVSDSGVSSCFNHDPLVLLSPVR